MVGSKGPQPGRTESRLEELGIHLPAGAYVIWRLRRGRSGRKFPLRERDASGRGPQAEVALPIELEVTFEVVH